MGRSRPFAGNDARFGGLGPTRRSLLRRRVAGTNGLWPLLTPALASRYPARGALIDEAALLDALKSGHIRHGGFDVFHNEPLKGDHPLTKLDNVTLSAHAAFRTLEASMTLLRRALDIVKQVRG